MCVWIFPCAQFQKTMDLFTDRTACNGEESQTGHQKPGLSPVPLLNPRELRGLVYPKVRADNHLCDRLQSLESLDLTLHLLNQTLGGWDLSISISTSSQVRHQEFESN